MVPWTWWFGVELHLAGGVGSTLADPPPVLVAPGAFLRIDQGIDNIDLVIRMTEHTRFNTGFDQID